MVNKVSCIGSSKTRSSDAKVAMETFDSTISDGRSTSQNFCSTGSKKSIVGKKFCIDLSQLGGTSTENNRIIEGGDSVNTKENFSESSLRCMQNKCTSEIFDSMHPVETNQSSNTGPGMKFRQRTMPVDDSKVNCNVFRIQRSADEKSGGNTVNRENTILKIFKNESLCSNSV